VTAGGWSCSTLAGGAQVGRITVQPGWRWLQDVRPAAGTDLCMAPRQRVVGDEPVVAIDWQGASVWATRQA
jgi:hypothetical protein